MAIKIDKTGKIPQRAGKSSDEFCETLRTIKVGESFVYQLRSYERLGLALAGKLLERQFVTRNEEGGKGLFRIWRVS